MAFSMHATLSYNPTSKRLFPDRERPYRIYPKMALTETITWLPADEPPDEGITVLVACKVDGQGCYDTFEAILDSGQWMSVDGVVTDRVTHWAEMPEGPKL